MMRVIAVSNRRPKNADRRDVYAQSGVPHWPWPQGLLVGGEYYRVLAWHLFWALLRGQSSAGPETRLCSCFAIDA